MSHFTVMVISTKGKKNVESQLAPFQENNMGDCPEEFMTFVDREPELRQAWETGKGKRMKDKQTGELLDPYDDRFKIPKEKKDPFDRGYEYGNPDPERYEAVEVAFTELYPSFDDYAEHESGMTRTENEDGELRYGYWENPDAKWDWYAIGGRWAGMLHLKPGVEKRADPEPSWGWSPEEREELLKSNRADMARKREIDWEGMMAVGQKEAEATWDKAAAVCGVDERGHIKQPGTSWEAYIEQVKAGTITIDQAREQYRAQPEVQAFDKSGAGGFMGSISDFDCPREEYGRRGANDAISTFAVLVDGKWHERGEMGWWGMSTDTDEEAREWRDGFYDVFIKDLPDNAMITIVDCHI